LTRLHSSPAMLEKRAVGLRRRQRKASAPRCQPPTRESASSMCRDNDTTHRRRSAPSMENDGFARNLKLGRPSGGNRKRDAYSHILFSEPGRGLVHSKVPCSPAMRFPLPSDLGAICVAVYVASTHRHEKGHVEKQRYLLRHKCDMRPRKSRGDFHLNRSQR
jgi:hypothetical protein